MKHLILITAMFVMFSCKFNDDPVYNVGETDSIKLGKIRIQYIRQQGEKSIEFSKRFAEKNKNNYSAWINSRYRKMIQTNPKYTLKEAEDEIYGLFRHNFGPNIANALKDTRK